MAMIIVFSSYAQQIVKFGFGDVIIQDNTLGDKEISSIFWLNTGLGVVLCLAFMLLAKPIAAFYKEPELVPLILAMSAIFIFKSLSIVQDSLFRKALNFKVIAIRNMGSVIIAGISALVLAFNNFGVWALVAQQIILSFANTFLIWIKSTWRPLLVFSSESIKKILPFGSSVFFESTLYHISKSMDKVLIGKYIGSSPLGFYSKTFSVMSILSNLTLVMRSVLFPSFSKIKDDEKKTSYFYLLLNESVLFVLVPIIVFLIISADPFVHLVFGSQWASVIPLVKLFALSIPFVAINNLFDPILRSSGNGSLLVKDSFYKKGISVVCIIVGLRYGLVGVAAGKVIGDFISVLITMRHATITSNITAKEFITPILKIILLGLVVGSILFYYHNYQTIITNRFMILAINFIITILTYLILSYFFKVKIFQEILSALRGLVKAKQSTSGGA